MMLQRNNMINALLLLAIFGCTSIQEMDDENIILFTKYLLILQLNVISLYLALELEKSKRWLNRRWLRRPLLDGRGVTCYYATTFQELKEDSDMFKRVFRMDLDTYIYLCEMVSVYLFKPRSNIHAEQRLAMTLRYLSTGDSIVNLAVAFKVGVSSCYKIIRETSDIIFKVLSPIYLKVPTEQEWKSISDGFLHDWNLPNCCGSIDGKHINIKAPPNSGSLYFNYKKHYSLILLATCDYKYQFTLFDVGAVGSESDGGVFARSELGKGIRDDRLNFPKGTKALPGTNIEIPYFFIGDDAFELAQNMLKPYSYHSEEEVKKIFNYRISRARRVIENSFGILVSRWQFLNKPVGLRPKFTVKCILAAISLHNFLMSKTNESRNAYCPPGYADEEINNEIIAGEWRQQLEENHLENINRVNFGQNVLNAEHIRTTLAHYFITEQGQVPWQWEYVRRGLFQDSDTQ